MFASFPALTRLSRGEDGLSLVLVAVTMVTLIGMVAFAVDAGAIYAERRELQSGATAAVLAIAEDCGIGLPCDNGTAMATAEQYADANASDLAASIHTFDLDTAAQTVSVTTQTEDTAGSTILAPFFAQVIGFAGGTVGASASAAWGFPSSGSVLPLIISDCEWDKVKDNPPDDPAYPVIFFFHDGNTTDDCAAQAGQDWDMDDRLPGGFGWLDTGGDDCSADVAVDNWVGEDPGASPSTGCSPAALKALILDKDVAIPYFYDVRGLGANGEYRVSGLGGFHVTGYNFGGQYKEPSAASAPCSGDKRCIAGYISSKTTTSGELGGEDRGLLIVKLTG